MLRTVAALGFLIALVAFASGAQAATQKLWNTCAGKDAEAAIKACTRILAGKESHKDQANAFAHRGSAYDNKGDYDRAIADYTRAIELDGACSSRKEAA